MTKTGQDMEDQTYSPTKVIDGYKFGIGNPASPTVHKVKRPHLAIVVFAIGGMHRLALTAGRGVPLRLTGTYWYGVVPIIVGRGCL